MPTLSTIGAACARAWGFTSGLVKDQYFNLVSLLLPGNGTNGAQNNTFLDGSSNNFTITRNGNTTQGTFSPFSQTGWGNYFDGTGDTLTTAATTAYDFANNPFTIEAFVYTTSFATGQGIVSSQNNGSTNISGWVLTIETTGAIAFIDYSSGAGALVVQSSSGVILANKWHHVVVEKRGTGTNQFQIFVDGTAVATGTSNANIPSGTSNQPLTIANWRYATDPNREFTGYISNLRIVKSAVYNGTVAVPTSPFPTGTTNQVLLTCQSNRFIDSNTATTAQTLTVNGSPSVTPFSPFAPTSSYSAAAVGGSGYFDVVDDFLTWGPGSSVQFGTDNFTIEVWIYITVTPVGQYIIDARNSGQTTAFALLFGPTGSGRLAFFDGSIIAVDEATPSIKANEWTHCCVVRSGSTISLFINGVRAGVNSSYSGNMSTAPTLSYIGKRYAPVLGDDFEFPGYMSSLRIVKGTAVYDPTQTNITIPTAPLTAITNTSLLLNFTNAGVVDATAKNVLETVGNAQISNGAGGGKWGGGSIYFASASNSNLLGNTPSNWTFLHDGSTWTVEFWLYPTDISSFQGLIATNGAGSASIGLNFVIDAGKISVSFTRGVSGSAATFSSSAVLNANQWNYVGVTFTGSTKTCAFFINGASAGSSSNTGFAYSSSTSTYPPYIGQTGAPGFPYYFNGYIDDLRITRGVARTITANPTAPFPVQ